MESVERRTVAVSMTTSLPVRNFFLSGTMDRLRERFDVVVLATPGVARTLRSLGFDEGVRVVEVDAGREPRVVALLRQFKKKVYMEGRESATEAIWEKYQPRPLYQRLGGTVAKGLIRVFDARRLYRTLDWLDRRVNRDDRFVPLFRSEGIELFFAAHATTFPEEVLLRNAVAAKVHLVYMVLSWDHLSSKVLLPEDFELVMVWNELTRRELLATYPSFTPEQIQVVGVPQLDSYAQPPTQEYGEWCAGYGLDPAKRTLLFSTMPQVRHEQQHIILRRLLEEIRGGGLARDLQVLIKCHPFDNFEGYDALLEGNPVAIRRTNLEEGRSSDEWLPSRKEIEESRDCIAHCSINLNIFSTVTIEAAWFDRPIIHIAFDPEPIRPGRPPCVEYYSFEHFKGIVERDAAVMVHGYDELFGAIRRYLAEPSYKAEGRRRVVEDYVGSSVGRAGTDIAAALDRVLRS